MTGEHAPMLLTERDWQWWFRVSGPEATRLVHVQRALVETGIDPCPETVLGMSRTVLVGGRAAARLRNLADLWDREPAVRIEAPSGWPMADEASTVHADGHLRAIREPGLQVHRCNRGRGRQNS